MISGSPENNKSPQERNRNFHDNTVQLLNPMHLFNDPDYLLAIEHYQNGEFAACEALIQNLENRYPAHSKLQALKADIQMRLSLMTIKVSNKKEEIRQRKIAALKLIGFAIIGIVIVAITFFFSYRYLDQIVTSRQLEQQAAQAASLSQQVEQLLVVGQPQPAAEILENIRSLDPDFSTLPDLTARTEELLTLEENYLTAQDLRAQGKDQEALLLLREIESVRPGLWDVLQQIEAIESSE